MALRCGWLDKVILGGLSNIAKTLAKVTDDAPVIAITHNLDISPQIPTRVTLTIASHTHGGQFAPPFFGRPIDSSKYGQRRAIGHIVVGGKE
jgi:predicted MPP superfamily phosphohydrolase